VAISFFIHLLRYHGANALVLVDLFTLMPDCRGEGQPNCPFKPEP
jgi:hypothetical protein